LAENIAGAFGYGTMSNGAKTTEANIQGPEILPSIWKTGSILPVLDPTTHVGASPEIYLSACHKPGDGMWEGPTAPRAAIDIILMQCPPKK
jgi:hypothetical protein